MSRYLSPKLIQEIYQVKKTTSYKMLKGFKASGGKIYKLGRLVRVYDEDFDNYVRKLNEGHS